MTVDAAGLEAIDGALAAGSWQLRLEAVERVREGLRGLPKPPTVERLAALLGRASQDGKWEVRRAVAESLDLLPEPLTDELSARLESDTHHDVRAAAQRVQRRRKRAAREERRLDDRCAQAAARLARLGRAHGPEVMRAAEEAAWELLGAVVGPVAHDLRGVLLDERRAARDPDASGDLAAARARRWRFLEALTADLSDFTDQGALPPERAALRELVGEARELAWRKAGRRSTRALFEVEVERDLSVFAPRGRLLRALTNLLVNACEALEAGGLVRVSAHAADRRRAVVLRISDTGRGIAPADLARVWLPGVTTKRQEAGRARHTGWGLAIARRFVERDCQGAIEVASVPGRGTTFTLTLPAVARPPAGADSEETP